MRSSTCHTWTAGHGSGIDASRSHAASGVEPPLTATWHPPRSLIASPMAAASRAHVTCASSAGGTWTWDCQGTSGLRGDPVDGGIGSPRPAWVVVHGGRVVEDRLHDAPRLLDDVLAAEAAAVALDR